MKKLGIAASGVSLAGGITGNDIIFILGLILTCVNAIIEYLKTRKKKEEKDEDEE